MKSLKSLQRLSHIFFTFANRKIIEPQQFTSQQIQDKYHLVKSQTYQFLIPKLPQKHQIYRHQIQTPSGVLRKSAIHILPKQIPEINKRQKFSAITKKIQQIYEDSFKKCQKPQQFFHLNRKIKTQIKNKLRFIGSIEEKYKHYMLFTPYQEKLFQKTRQQYVKKGIKIACLDNAVIYPKGKGDVWMPTNQKYLLDFIASLKKMEGDKNIKDILDIGCGSGILSFLCKKSFKKAKVTAIDNNSSAVDTTNINAAEQRFEDITAILYDMTSNSLLSQKLKQQKLPLLYDLIVFNPPWLHAKKLPQQSQLQSGVYDQNGKVLESSLKSASQLLRDKDSKLLIIYSDLNKILNLQKKSVEELCKENSLLIHSVKERSLIQNLTDRSPLNQFKLKAKIQLYEIRKA